VADRSSALLISALTRAAAEAGGAPLHGGKNTLGLFPSTALGKQAAQRCRDEGYLHPVEETNGRAPVCAITEKGMRYLLGQASPRQVLEDCARILEEREGQLSQLLASARQAQAGLESLRSTIANVVAKLDTPAGDLKTLFAEFRQEKPTASASDPTPAILAALDRWAASGAQDDCPLPELFRQAGFPLTVGAFHDALRRLHSSGQAWLHPWTGPLYEIPEPPFALLVGHEIAYYASRRIDEG
jgi:hypothetical protein